ncbi:MAG TPA: glucosaminidase domain-containing protein [Burkholderiales bacterium]|nr:glucosaminidase domain-containing protein [Burkholderiales bacterium]
MEHVKKTVVWLFIFFLIATITSIEVYAPHSIEIDCWFFTLQPKTVKRVKNIQKIPPKNNALIKTYGNIISKVALSRQQEDKPFILPSVTIAQLVLETAGGTSKLMKEANNLFGIKATGREESVYYAWDDCGKNKCKFKKFKSPEECIEYYFDNVISSERYSKATAASEQGKQPKKVAELLKRGGYATDPNYAKKLDNIITAKNLTAYDTTPLLE